MIASAMLVAQLAYMPPQTWVRQTTTPHYLNEYLLPLGTYPSSIVAGPDGALWFGTYPMLANHRATHLGVARITTQGKLRFFHIGLGVFDISWDHAGKLWFTNAYKRPYNIGSLTPDGVVTHYSTPSQGTPESIATDPDGELWYVAFGANPDVFRIDANGKTIATYDTPRAAAVNVAPGRGEAMWTDLLGRRSHIGRFTTKGVFEKKPIGGPAYIPGRMTLGPDGRMWISDCTYAAAVSASFVVTLYPLPYANGCFAGFAVGADGNLWAADFDRSALVRINPIDGLMTEYPTPTPNMTPFSVTAGPDGNIWFTEIQNQTDVSKIGVLAP
jgi:virginiamycin B lyase